MKYRIREIFYSIQGEGYHAGTPAIFIRFSGCNLACKFCDTDHTRFEEMEDIDIWNECKQYPSKIIVFTGGEPALQLDNHLLAGFNPDMKFHIETNGSIDISGLNLHWITVSPKNTIKQNQGDELKLLVHEKTHEKTIDTWGKTDFKHFYLQPISQGRKATERAVKYLLKHPKWKLSIQLHKLIGVR